MQYILLVVVLIGIALLAIGGGRYRQKQYYLRVKFANWYYRAMRGDPQVRDSGEPNDDVLAVIRPLVIGALLLGFGLGGLVMLHW